MKLKNILLILLPVVTFCGCTEDDSIGCLDNISLDKTYLTISEEGGEAVLNIIAQDEWAFAPIFQQITKHDDGSRDTTYNALPAWLSASTLAGGSGETQVTFHADASAAGRETELQIKAGEYTQFLIVRQGSLEAAEATCAEIIAGPDKTYRVTGTITSIANTHYGNLYIADETGQVYIYGTNDKDGKKGNDPIDSWGLEVGDVITVEGPKQLYNGTVELVDVTVLNVKKSLLKVVTPEQTVGVDGADIDVVLAYKGSGAYVQLPDDCDWVSVLGQEYKAGTATLFEPNPADTAIVHLRVAPNTDLGRKAAINFSSSNVSNSSTITWALTQDAFVLPHGETADDPFTIAEAIAKCQEIGTTSDGVIYYAHGYISNIKEVSTSFGNATFNISDDGSDENALTVYRTKWLENAAFTSEDQIGVGDEVIICGKLVNYTRDGSSFTPEFSGNVYIYSHKQAGPGSRLRPFTADEAIEFVSSLPAGETTADDYYVAGEIVKIKYTFSAQYGTATFFIAADDDPANEQFQVYSCYYLGNRPWVDGDTQIQLGDQVVVCGKLVNYNGNTPETASKKAYIYSLNGVKE